ncbi:hypothetical protein NPIL_88981 [Nephila pilipes]|uniref:Uncharacterized protein n=1 Tax=Nephila pilipes TaxID=299642 RepID=A0A8X6UAX0_NEPPI|nr:hypothetical protein NPIL_88981 [Nephila pilipes]
MAKDRDTLIYIRYVFNAAKHFYTKVTREMTDNNQPSEGKFMHASSLTFKSAKSKFLSNTKPIIDMIMEKNMPIILRKISANVTVVLQSLDIIEANYKTLADELRTAVYVFLLKHKEFDLNSDSSYFNTHTLPLLRKDFERIKFIVLELFDEYLSTKTWSWINFINKRHAFLDM